MPAARLRLRLLAGIALVAALGIIAPRARSTASEPPAAPHEPKVRVDISGDTIRVDVDFLVDAPIEQVWAVLTDFENMPKFISNLKESKVLERSSERALLLQKGVASFGPVTFSFEAEREIRLTPTDRVQSKLLRGNLKRYAGDTSLHARGRQTRIVFHSEAATDAFIPPYFGRRFVENETREQYLEIAAEIARRMAALPTTGSTSPEPKAAVPLQTTPTPPPALPTDQPGHTETPPAKP
jgi:uncharacterized membrane protein